MLQMADVKPGDFVIDLGSGDGRIAIAAAKKGARALGVDIDPERVHRSAGERKKGRRPGQGDVSAPEPVRHQDRRGDRPHHVPADQGQPAAAAPHPGRAEARNARRLARLRHGRLETRHSCRDRTPAGLHVDRAGQGRRAAGRAGPARKASAWTCSRSISISGACADRRQDRRGARGLAARSRDAPDHCPTEESSGAA